MSAAAIDAYNALVARDADVARAEVERLRQGFVSRGITFGGESMRTFLRPHFVAREEWNVLRRTGVQVLEIAARVARQVFDGDAARLCAFLGTPAGEIPWVTIDPGEPDVVLSRLDAFVTPAGPRFIEINSDAPAGFGYGDCMAEAFAELPLFQEFARHNLVSYEPSSPRLVDAVLGLARASGTPDPTIAIVDWAEVKTRADQEILRESFLRRGARCILADPREMSIVDGRLHAPEGPVDVVYRRGVLSELVEREADVRVFLHAYREGLAMFVNSFRCRLSEDKAFFAILTDEAYASFLTPEERTLMATVLPWTRKVEERKTVRGRATIDLVPHVIAERERLVLKPAHGYGGDSVFVGSDTTAAEWERAVQTALGGPWVVQERVTIPEEMFPVFDEAGGLTFEPLKVNANPFYVAGAEVGAVTRVSRSNVINVTAGGGSLPTFVVG